MIPACGKKQATNQGGRLGGQTFYFANGTEPQDLDPQLVTDVPKHHILTALLERLVA